MLPYQNTEENLADYLKILRQLAMRSNEDDSFFTAVTRHCDDQELAHRIHSSFHAIEQREAAGDPPAPALLRRMFALSFPEFFVVLCALAMELDEDLRVVAQKNRREACLQYALALLSRIEDVPYDTLCSWCGGDPRLEALLEPPMQPGYIADRPLRLRRPVSYFMLCGALMPLEGLRLFTSPSPGRFAPIHTASLAAAARAVRLGIPAVAVGIPGTGKRTLFRRACQKEGRNLLEADMPTLSGLPASALADASCLFLLAGLAGVSLCLTRVDTPNSGTARSISRWLEPYGLPLLVTVDGTDGDTWPIEWAGVEPIRLVLPDCLDEPDSQSAAAFFSTETAADASSSRSIRDFAREYSRSRWDRLAKRDDR